MSKTLHLFILLTLLVIGGGINTNAQTTVTQTSFTATSGNVDGDKNVSYKAEKGKANTAPAINNGIIRVYQNGGLFTVSVADGCQINNVTLGSAMKTTVTYVTDKNTTASATKSIAANGNVSVNLSGGEKSITFTCTGTTRNDRLYVNSLSVTYSSTSTGKTATALAFADPADKTLNLNAENGAAIISNPASLTPTVEGATITYTSTDNDFASVDTNGDVLVDTKAEGTATITATYAGNDEYDGATASYKISVVDPNKASWSYIFQSGDLKDTTTSYTFSNVAWAFTPTWKTSAYTGIGNLDSKKGIQLCSSNNSASSLVFSSTGFPGIIKEVKVNASTANSATATISVTVSGVSYGEAKSLTTSSADYTFTGTSAGEVVITLSQPSTSKALYIKSIDIEYNPNAEVKTATIDENSTEKNFEAGTYTTVTLKRTFNDNAWNTLVLPFDLTAEQVTSAFGSDAKVASYTGATAGADGTYTLNFKEATTITANTPVFIYGAQANDKGYTFTGVEVKDATPTQTADGFNFVGTYTKTTVPQGNFFINSQNKFYKAGDNQTNIKATRATFAPATAAASEAKGLGFNVDEGGTATAINAVTFEEETNANAPIYNLAGQRVSKSYKGVVLQNGKKFLQK